MLVRADRAGEELVEPVGRDQIGLTVRAEAQGDGMGLRGELRDRLFGRPDRGALDAELLGKPDRHARLVADFHLARETGEGINLPPAEGLEEGPQDSDVTPSAPDGEDKPSGSHLKILK